MMKKIIPLICLIAVWLTVLCPLCTGAATPLDPTANASLTLHYQKAEQPFSELQVDIYRVAEAFSDGTFELIEPYSSYPINIHDITMQEQWKNTAATLSSYIVANQLAPNRQGTTNEAGIVFFDNLETGLYLVREVTAENNSGNYIFDQFMVYLPAPLKDGSYDYTVEAKPKCTGFVAKTEYRVTKLWQDSGNKTDRTKEVTVDIYKDGKLQDTQVLSANNNWSYKWYVSDKDNGKWTVAERTVADKYTVTIQQNGSSFTIINTHKSNSQIPDTPQTGDTTNLLPYILAMCISGVLLIVLGIYRWRRKYV